MMRVGDRFSWWVETVGDGGWDAGTQRFWRTEIASYGRPGRVLEAGDTGTLDVFWTGGAAKGRSGKCIDASTVGHRHVALHR